MDYTTLRILDWRLVFVNFTLLCQPEFLNVKSNYFWFGWYCDIESSPKKELGNLGQPEYRGENLQNLTKLPQVI